MLESHLCRTACKAHPVVGEGVVGVPTPDYDDEGIFQTGTQEEGCCAYYFPLLVHGESGES